MTDHEASAVDREVAIYEEREASARNAACVLAFFLGMERAHNARLWADMERPIPMVLFCPACGVQHIDAPDERTYGWVNPPHRSHLCHGCGHIWRPCDLPTEGVAEVKTKGKNDSPSTSNPGELQRELTAALELATLRLMDHHDSALHPARGPCRMFDRGSCVVCAKPEDHGNVFMKLSPLIAKAKAGMGAAVSRMQPPPKVRMGDGTFQFECDTCRKIWFGFITGVDAARFALDHGKSDEHASVKR